MRNIKEMWLAGAGAALLSMGACALGPPPDGTAAVGQAVTGDFADMASRYGWSLTGNASYESVVIGLKVAESDFDTLRQMVEDETGLDASGIVIKDRNNATSNYPGTTDQAELEKLAEAISGIMVANQDAPIRVLDCTAADSTNFNAAYQHIPGDGVVTATYTIASNLQGTVSTFLSNHTGIVPVVPQGFLASSLAVQVGFTQDSGGSDVKWTSNDGGDIMALGHAIPFPWATGGKDSLFFGAGAIAGRLNNQSGAPATRAVLLAADGSHFQAITGSASTLGVFADGGSL